MIRTTTTRLQADNITEVYEYLQENEPELIELYDIRMSKDSLYISNQSLFIPCGDNIAITLNEVTVQFTVTLGKYRLVVTLWRDSRIQHIFVHS